MSIDDFYKVVAKRYKKKSIIITSNKKFNDWGQVLYEAALTTTTLDRLVHHSNFVIIRATTTEADATFIRVIQNSHILMFDSKISMREVMVKKAI